MDKKLFTMKINYLMIAVLTTSSVLSCSLQNRLNTANPQTDQVSISEQSSPSITPISQSPAKKSTQDIPKTPSKEVAVIQKGKQLYAQNCIFCHQKDAIGKPGKAPSLTNPDLLSISSVDFFAITIAEGRPTAGMPPFTHLGDENIYAVTSYLFSFANRPSRATQINQQPPAEGSAANGKELFNSICMPCHGMNGDGYMSGGTGTAIGKPDFLDNVSDGFIRTTIKEGRSDTRMMSYQGPAGLANLTDAEIDDIITYLRTVPSR